MLFHSLHISLSSNVVGFYGAILATITASIQTRNYFRDRVRVRISVQPDMAVFGDPNNMTFTMVQVANAGRRPLTITAVGAFCLHPNQCWAFVDIAPRLPYELNEGQYLQAKVDQEGLDFAVIEYWYAIDALGRKHKLRAAPWYRRWLSYSPRALARRLQHKTKAAN